MRNKPSCVGKKIASVVTNGRPWTASQITGSPEPPPPYRLERVFPKLQFDHPLEILRTPSVDRMFVIDNAWDFKRYRAVVPRLPEVDLRTKQLVVVPDKLTGNFKGCV